MSTSWPVVVRSAVEHVGLERSRRNPPIVIRQGASERRLEEGRLVIGRGPEAGLLVDHPTVSDAHVSLELVTEGVLVKDLESECGTFYLGEPLRESVLAPGAKLRLGEAELSIEADSSGLSACETPHRYGELWSVSPQMGRLFSVLERLEGSLAGVLIEGESGTGKELVARAIHEHSAVSGGPFVTVNCGALDRELVKSELFGHRRGAFTGAVECRTGAFEAADGGTIFLDELGELPLDVQPTLLRVLEQRTVVRVGENNPRRVNVRVIAATNRRLEEQVRRDRFRQDLYYRIMVVRLELPALRERTEDIPLLAQRFAGGLTGATLTQSVLAELARHDWPGNVRELRHAVESYLAVGCLPFGAGSSASPVEQALNGLIDVDVPYAAVKEQFTDLFLRSYLTRLLGVTSGNVSEAARVSGMERSYLSKLCRRLGVKS